MYTKDQMKSFGDWLASRKDVVTGNQIDEYIAGISTVGSADVVERVEAELMKMVSDGREHYGVREMAEMACPIIEAEVERRVRGYREALEDIIACPLYPIGVAQHIACEALAKEPDNANRQ